MADRLEIETPLSWLVHIARSEIAPSRMDDEIDTIVAQSCCRNLERGITGALIASDTYFAQYIEGPEPTVTALVERIRRDPRQADLHVIQRGERAERRFPGWSMAYSGRSVFVRRIVRDLFDGARQARAMNADILINLMHEFTPLQE